MDFNAYAKSIHRQNVERGWRDDPNRSDRAKTHGKKY